MNRKKKVKLKYTQNDSTLRNNDFKDPKNKRK